VAAPAGLTSDARPSRVLLVVQQVASFRISRFVLPFSMTIHIPNP
jgi:hypothetical protein